jgi:hypothetical protein
MAKLSSETLEAIWTLLKQLSRIVEDAGDAEFSLFDRFGETDSTLPYLTYLKDVAEESASRYSQLANIRLRIAEAQPDTPTDMLRLLYQGISQSQSRIPALERTVQEIKMEWNLL